MTHAGTNCTAARVAACHRVQCTDQAVTDAMWGLLGADNVVPHLLNSVLMLAELALNRLPLRHWHVWFVGLWPLAFALFQYLVWWPLTHQWVYGFMASDAPGWGVVFRLIGLLLFSILLPFATFPDCNRWIVSPVT